MLKSFEGAVRTQGKDAVIIADCLTFLADGTPVAPKKNDGFTCSVGTTGLVTITFNGKHSKLLSFACNYVHPTQNHRNVIVKSLSTSAATVQIVDNTFAALAANADSTLYFSAVMR